MSESEAGQPRLDYVFTSRQETAGERLGASATIDGQRNTPPSPAGAERLIWPEIWDVTTRALGDGDWRPSLNWLDVIELRGG